MSLGRAVVTLYDFYRFKQKLSYQNPTRSLAPPFFPFLIIIHSHRAAPRLLIFKSFLSFLIVSKKNTTHEAPNAFRSLLLATYTF